MNKILLERHITDDDDVDYKLTIIDDKHTLLFGNGYTQKAKGKFAASIEDTGDDFVIELQDASIDNPVTKTVTLDYSQAVNVLELLLLTHREYKFSVSSEPEALN